MVKYTFNALGNNIIWPSYEFIQCLYRLEYSFTGFTPQNMLSSGNTPHNLLGSTPHNLLSASGATPRGLDQGKLLL